MIQHIVLLNWKEGVSQPEIDAVTAGFTKLKETVNEIVSYKFGADQGFYQGNADYALVATFTSELDFKNYVKHPAHQAFMANIAKPILESFQSIQINVNI